MSNGKSPKKIIDLNKYDDPIDLSPKNLEIGLWLANNRKRIYKVLIIILASIAAGFILYSGYGYFYYFVFGQEQDRVIEGDTSGVDLAAYRTQNTPSDLLYSNAQVIASNVGSDFIVHLKNPNDKQSATFSFCFTAGEGETCGNSFILPNEEKDLLIVNSNIKTTSGSADFTIKNISWQKLKAGEIPDWNVFRDQHLNFAISEPKFSNYDGKISYLEFNITNNTSYGYFEIPLNITISHGSEVVAVNRYVIKELNSYKSKLVRLAWPEAANLGGSIKITPEINILDSNVYKPYSSN